MYLNRQLIMRPHCSFSSCIIVFRKMIMDLRRCFKIHFFRAVDPIESCQEILRLPTKSKTFISASRDLVWPYRPIERRSYLDTTSILTSFLILLKLKNKYMLPHFLITHISVKKCPLYLPFTSSRQLFYLA